jgi:hypothetical protein
MLELRKFSAYIAEADKPESLNLNDNMPGGAPAAAPAGPAPLAAGPGAPGEVMASGEVCELPHDDAQENQLTLLYEWKKLRDKLSAKGSYPGREADEARLEEIDRKLGGPANQCPAPSPKATPVAEPPPKDPRVAELARETRKELDELDPDTASLTDRKLNGPMIKDYYEHREALTSYLNNIDVKTATSKSLGDWVMKSWAATIYDAGELRRILAGNLEVQYRESIDQEKKHLQNLNNDLKVLKDKNKRVEKALEKIDDGVKWAGRLLKLNDAVELVTNYAESIGKVGTVLEKAALVATGAKIVTQSGIIEQGIENLAQYYSQVTLAVEGFASVKELEDAIKANVDAIKDSVNKIGYLTDRRDRAKRIYDTAVSEALKK